MNKADRTERLRALSQLALGIIRRCGQHCCVNRTDGRWRISEVRYNGFKLARSRLIDDEYRTSKLDVRYLGKIVLHVEWTTDAVARTSYRPGSWEALLLRYDRTPALAGRVEART